MHTTFLPTIFYCTSLLVAWFCKLALIPANWVLDQARGLEKPHLFAAAALGIVVVACGSGVSALSMFQSDKKQSPDETATTPDRDDPVLPIAPAAADPKKHVLIISRPSLLGGALPVIVSWQGKRVARLDAHEVLRVHFPTTPASVTLEDPRGALSINVSWETSDVPYYVDCSITGGPLLGHLSYRATKGEADHDMAGLILAGKVRDVWLTNNLANMPPHVSSLEQLARLLNPQPSKTFMDLPFALNWQSYGVPSRLAD
jgi:hypothetical protein